MVATEMAAAVRREREVDREHRQWLRALRDLDRQTKRGHRVKGEPNPPTDLGRVIGA